jgi:hypothetical protein
VRGADQQTELVRAVIARVTDDGLDAQKPHLHHLDSWEVWDCWRDLIVDLQRHHDCGGGCRLGSLASELSDVDDRARRLLVDRIRSGETLARTSA